MGKYDGRVKSQRPPNIIVPPPRATQGTRAAVGAMVRASALACMVRDEGPDGLGEYLDELDRGDLYAVVVALAAMVPVDQPADELLAWLEGAGLAVA